MSEKEQDIKFINNSLKIKNEEITYMLLKQIASEEPVGALMLRGKLLDHDMDFSTATIGRYLRELDYKKYTIQISNQGRILTDTGRYYLEKLEAEVERAQLHGAFSKAMEIRDYETLVELFNARVAIERETSALAARNATPEERKELLEIIKNNRELIEGKMDPTSIALDLHIAIARCSHNRFMLTLLEMLIFEEKQIEDHFLEETYISRERGPQYLIDHEEIVKAIVEGDSSLANHHMGKHLSKIINSFIQEKKKVVFPVE